jgi:hypothetical protein
LYHKQAGIAILISNKVDVRVKLPEVIGNTVEHIDIVKNLSRTQRAHHFRERMNK